MSMQTTREWVEQQIWYKPEERHYGEECKQNHCKCIREEDELAEGMKI